MRDCSSILRPRHILLVASIFGIAFILLPSLVSAEYFGVQCWQNDGNYSKCNTQGSACSWVNNSGVTPKNTFCPYNYTSFNTTYSSTTGNMLVNAGCCSSGGGGTQGCFTYDKNETACTNDNTCDWKANNVNQNPSCWNTVGCCQKKGCWSFNGNNNTCIASLDGACTWSNKTLAGATNDAYCSDASGCCYDKTCNDATSESTCNNLKTQLSKPCHWNSGDSTCGYQGSGTGGGGFTFYNDTDTCMKQGGWWNGSGSCNTPTSGSSGGGGGGFLFASEVKCWFADQRATVCGNVSGCVYCDDATTELNNATSACFNMPSGMCQGHQSLSAATDINQSAMTCGDIRLKQTCSCGPMPNCVWSNSSTITGNFCTVGVKTASDTQSCTAPVQFCEDNKAKNNQTLCNQLASDYMMPCKWDAGSTGKVSKNCTFNSVACFGSGDSGLGSFDFNLISGEQQCTAAGGTWKTEYYDDSGSLKQDSWCEKGALFSSVSGTAFSNKGSCDSDCWACEFNTSGANYGGNVSLATSSCLNSKKGVCQWKNDSNAPNSLGWCDYPKEFSYGGAKDCNTDCKACEFSGNASSASSACFGSIAGCTWINDTNAFKGGICISGSKKACNTDCFSCYDQQTCTNTTVHAALNCSWDTSANFCKPSAFTGEICFNGKDDDNDVKADCADSDCSFDQFCGGSTVSTGSSFNATDCKKISIQASCTANQTNGKNCTWADPDWGPAYCDFPGSSCWLYETSTTSCKTDIGCMYKNATAGYNITTMANGTLNFSAFNTNIAFAGGRCDVNQTKVSRCTNSTLYNNQTECWKYNATESCTWVNDTYISNGGGRCEFKPYGVCWGLKSASTCGNEGNCTWRNDSYSQHGGGFCEPVCFSLSAATCGNSGGLCSAKTTACEPEHYSTTSHGTAGGGCHEYDNNYGTCKNQNVTCIWKNFTFGGNMTQGTCNEKGQFALLETLDMSPPKILGHDTNDTGSRTYVDIREYGIKDSTETLAFGIMVTNITDAVACKGYYLNTLGFMPGMTPILGSGTNTTKFYWYLDTNKNVTDNCNATRADGTNDTGYEFLIKYATTLTNNSVIETRSFYKCAGRAWSLTNVPLTSNRELMCGVSVPSFGSGSPGKTGGVMIVVDKENLESFVEYNKTAPMRVFVASANESKSESNPSDSVSSAGYYTQGSADFKFVDCGNPDTKDDKCKNFQKFGFNVFEDCKNGKDDDADGSTDCDDMKCSYTPNCASGGNAFNFVANANDFTTPSVLYSSTDPLHISAFIKFDTDEPANGSIAFYSNDSSCGNAIATYDEVGDTSIAFDDYKPFHGVAIENGTNGVNLSNGTTYFYKTTICDPTSNCATSACQNFTTKKDSNYKPFVFKMKLPSGYNVTIPALNYSGNFTTNISGKVYETGIKTNASVTRNINVTFNCGTQSLTLAGVDITKPKSIDLSTAFACDPANNVLGMNSTSKGWNQVVSDLGMGGQSDYLKLTFPVSYDSGNTIKWCNDALSNCTTVNTYANCSSGGTSKTDCKIPTSLGFSAYQVTVASSGSSSGGGGGGGGGGGAAAATSFSPTATQLAAGYTQTLAKGNVVKFVTPDNKNHTTTLDSVTATTATITVASTPQTVTLLIGETKKFELTGDSIYDLSVTLISITNATKAALTLKSISEQIPTGGQAGTTAGGQAGGAGAATDTGGSDGGAETRGSLWQLPAVKAIVLIIVLAFIIAVVISAVHRTRHSTQKDIQGRVKVSSRSKDIRVSSWFAFLFG